jgi:hypothetical protein
LTSPLPPFSFITSSPIPGIVSTGIIFSVYIQVYIVFALYSLSYTFFPPPPPSHWYQLP